MKVNAKIMIEDVEVYAPCGCPKCGSDTTLWVDPDTGDKWECCFNFECTYAKKIGVTNQQRRHNHE